MFPNWQKATWERLCLLFVVNPFGLTKTICVFLHQVVFVCSPLLAFGGCGRVQSWFLLTFFGLPSGQAIIGPGFCGFLATSHPTKI